MPSHSLVRVVPAVQTLQCVLNKNKTWRTKLMIYDACSMEVEFAVLSGICLEVDFAV